MKLKYYLRGLGIGIIVTTIVLAVSFSKRETTISDEEIIARAAQLGMVMQEETGEPETDTETAQRETEAEPETGTGTEPETENETQTGEEDTAGTQTGAEDAEGDTAGTGDDQTAAETYRLTVHSGDVCRVICQTLADNGVVSDAEALRKYIFETGNASNIRAGEYDIPYGADFAVIVEILMAGPL